MENSFQQQYTKEEKNRETQNRKQSTYYRFSLKNQTHLKLLLYITRNHMLLSMFEVNKKDQDHTLKNIPNLSEDTSQLNLI